jgi:hypothetical protein
VWNSQFNHLSYLRNVHPSHPPNKHVEETTYLYKLVKSRKVQEYIAKQREDMGYKFDDGDKEGSEEDEWK